MIHFKRFRQQNGKGPDAAKLTTMVKFPLNAFDMSPHLARGSTSSNDSLNKEDSGGGSNSSRHLSGSPWRKPREHYKYKEKEKEPKDNRYDLYAVCYHQGETLETGHYTAACKNPYDHQWYKFDDQRVTHVPADQVQDQIINNEAYILFYQRRKIDNSECSGTSSTSGDHWVSRIPVPPPSLSSTSSNPTASNGDIQVITASTSAIKSTLSSNSHENSIEKSIDDKTTDENKKKIDSNRKCENGQLQEAINEFNEKFITKQQQQTITEAIFIEKTDENEVVDVEGLEDNEIINNKEEENDNNDANKLKSTQFNSTDIKSTISTPNILNRKITTNNNHNLIAISSLSSSTTNDHEVTKLQKQNSPIEIRNKEKKERNSEFSDTKNKNLKDIWPNNTENNDISKNTISKIGKLIQNNDEKNIYNSSNSNDDNIYEKINKDTSTVLTSIKNKTSSNENDNDELGITETTEFHNNNIKLRHSFSSTSSNFKLRDTTCDTLSMLRNTNNSCSKDTLIYIDQQNHHHHHHNLIEEDDTFLGSRSIWVIISFLIFYFFLF